MNRQWLRNALLLLVLLLIVVAAAPQAVSARALLEAGSSTWRYLDGGVAPPARWTQQGFDDSQWKTGTAPLGYGEPRLVTELRKEGADAKQAVTAWFRCEFKPPKLAAGESLVVSTCVDDGAVIYLNGHEVGRVNMPRGPVTAKTFASQTLGDSDEGLYDRQRIDAKLLKPGQTNVLAVEVHQAAATSSDLFFDLALKILPFEAAEARVSPAAEEIITLFNKQHYIGPGVKVPDGYIDGGRGMKVDGGGTASSGREILTIDRKHDTELAADLALARSSEMRALPELQRIERIATLIDKETTPPAGLRLVGKTTELLEKEFTNKPVLIGDWVDQCHAGVCRHRALLFKILADEAGLRAALVRGNFAKQGPPGFAHAWNEVQLGDGHRVLIDVMHNGGKANFRELNSEYVVEHYLKVDGTPWYMAASH